MPTGGKIVGSPQQKAIWQSLARDKCHVIVRALAGTGKTTTCVEGMKWLPERDRTDCVFVAFNKTVQLHMQSLLPEGAQALTSHGLGLRALKRGLGNVKVELD